MFHSELSKKAFSLPLLLFTNSSPNNINSKEDNTPKLIKLQRLMANEKPISFDVMFTGLDRNRKCKTQTIVFLPKSIKSIQAISLLYILLHDDVKILSKLKFQPNFNEADKAIESFHNIVNSIAEY